MGYQRRPVTVRESLAVAGARSSDIGAIVGMFFGYGSSCFVMALGSALRSWAGWSVWLGNGGLTRTEGRPILTRCADAGLVGCGDGDGHPLAAL
jgi:hypothetical protein